MSIEDKIKQIEELKPKAIAIAKLIGTHPVMGKWGRGNDFARAHRFDPSHSFDKDGTRFRFGGYASVKFSNFRAANREATYKIHPPVMDPKNTKVLSVHITDVDNPDDVKASGKLRYTRSSYDTKASEIAHQASVALSTTTEASYQTSYMGNTLKATMTLSLETSYGFSKSDSKESGESLETLSEYDYEIDPHTRMSFVQEVKLGRSRLRTDVTGFLDCDIEIWSHEDFTVDVPGYERLEEWLCGYARSDMKFAKLFKDNPYSRDNADLKEAVRPIEMTVSIEHECDNTLNEKIAFTKSPLRTTGEEE